MAATTIEPEIKDEKIVYEVIRMEDAEQVLKLLKNTFFKVKIPFPTNVWFSLQFPFTHFSIPLTFHSKRTSKEWREENRYNGSVAFHVFFANKCHDDATSLHWTLNGKQLDVPNNPSFAQQKKMLREENPYSITERKRETFLFYSIRFPSSLLLQRCQQGMNVFVT